MWALFVFSLAALCAGQVVVVEQPESMPVLDGSPIVNIAQGTVQGMLSEDGSYFAFYGIPYADTTSGANRFKAPNPPLPFGGVFEANRKNIKCVRPLGVGFQGTEDCLVADVFSKNIIPGANQPVMVWIKGREFDHVREPALSFQHFVENDIVVVSLNFRESILGFLCLGTETAPGNAGLKDIIAGLLWVRENIAQFGGDPNSVTLFGHGSGAAAVDLITLSPMSTGLIHRAIAQSGTAIAPWAVTRDNLEYALEIAAALGHDVQDVEELSEIFTRTSLVALMAVINELDLTDNSLAFAPCLERETLQAIEHFLIKSPYETIHDGDFAQIPFMTGFVEVEGTIRAEEAVYEDWLQRMDDSFEDFLQPDLKFENETERHRIAEDIRAYYFRNESVAIDDYLSYHGDTIMLIATVREAYMRAAVSNSSLYLYQFSYKGTLGEIFVDGPLNVERASHSEELAYLFYDNTEYADLNIPDLDLAISDILIERWTNFAKTGDPRSEISQVVWEPFTAEDAFYLRMLDDDEVIEGTLEVELRDPHSEALAFWNGIYEDHFLDAKSRWQLNDRDDGDDVDVVEGSGEGDEDDEEDGDDDDDEPDSASTAVGYTFLIISLFAVLNQFHWLQILS